MMDMKLPDGTIIEDVPEGMSMDQVLSAIKAANPGAYKMLLAGTEAGPGLEPSALARVGRGMMDPFSGARQLLPESVGGFSPEQEAAELENVSLYEKGAGDGIDWLRLGGQAASLSPLGGLAAPARAGLLARAGIGAGTGAGAGGVLYAKDTDERRQNIVGGGLGGGLLAAAAPPLMNVAGRALGAAREGARALAAPKNMSQTITLELNDAAQQAGVNLAELGADVTKEMQRKAFQNLNRTGSTNADELVRLAQARRFGFVDDAAMTPGQSSRNPAAFSDELNMSKVDEVGEPLAARFENQRKTIDENLERFRTTLGSGEDISPFTAGESIESSARNVASKMQDKVRKAYEVAESARPDLTLSPDFFKKRTEQVLKDFEDKIPAGVKTRIKELVDGESRRFTPSEAAKLDKLITDTLPNDPFAKSEKMAARMLQESIADAMEEAGGRAGDFGHLYKQAKTVAHERFKAIGDPRQMTAKLVAESFDPGKVTQKLMTGPIRQIEHLKKFLQTDPEAWAKGQASVINEIIGEATRNGSFNQAAYNRAMKRITKDRLQVLYGKEAAQEMIDFGKVARDLISPPAGHRVNTSNTAPMVANLLREASGAVASTLPGGAILTGLRAAGKDAAKKGAQAKAVASILQPPRPPIPNLLESLDPYARGLSPVFGGLLGADR